MKPTTRLSFLLLMAVFCIITLASAQDATTVSTLAARPDETGESLPKFIKSSFPQDSKLRILAAFSKSGVADVFYNVNGEQAEQEILRKYSELSALPLRGRRAAFRRLSSAEKSALWQTQLALVLVKHPELNEWQKELILDAMLLLTPEHYEVPSNSPDWKAKVREPSRRLEQEITVAFASEDAARIFTTLGDNTETAKGGPTSAGPLSLKRINYQPVSDSGPYQQWVHSRFSTQDLDLDQSQSCGCSTVWDFCPAWRYCSQGSCSPPPQDGCGLGWSYPCNGVCR